MMLRRLWRLRLLLALLLCGASGLAYWWMGSRIAWEHALRAAGFADEMTAPGDGDRVLVVAPHPDDEVLGCGGMMQQATAKGAEVHVVLMTNGDGSELSLVFGEKELPWKAQSFTDLGRKRQEETLRALSLAGLRSSRVHFLGYPNNGLLALWRPEHWSYSSPFTSPYTRTSFSPYRRSLTPQAPYCGQQVLSDLVSIMHQVRPTAIFVTHPQDIHPDHFVSSMFVQYALATAAVRGAEWAGTARLYGYLIHWPQYPLPSGLRPKQDLLPAADLSGEDGPWLRLTLTEEQTLRKVRCIRSYRSQEPSFDRLLLAFARRNEAYELLPQAAMRAGIPFQWTDPGRRRRGLGGAQIAALQLTIQENLTVNANLISRGSRIPSNGYVCLDLRTWTEQGSPIITAVYVRAAGQASAIQAGAAGDLHGPPVSVTAVTPSELELTGVPLPRDSAALQHVFVACWGSVRDRLADPAVARWVRLADGQSR